MLGDIFNGLQLKIMESLSRDAYVKLNIVDNTSGATNFKWYFKISGVDKMTEWLGMTDRSNHMELLSNVTVSAIEGPAVGISNGAIVINWDGISLDGIGAAVNGVFNGRLIGSLEDNAGNTFFSDFTNINIADIVLSSSRNAALRSLGLVDGSLIVSPGFSAGGIEIDPARYLLVGLGVKGSTVAIYPTDFQVDTNTGVTNSSAANLKILRAIQAMAGTNAGNKIVISSWGNAGLFVRSLLQGDTNAPSMVAKVVEIGVPGQGNNSVAQAPAAFSFTLTMAPVMDWFQSFQIGDFSLNGFLADFGLDVEKMVGNVVRNDDIINPMNVLGLLLGRADQALAQDANSPLLQSLRGFSPTNVGVAVESMRTALWPTMPDAVQWGLIALAGAAGYAGLYQNVTLFSLDSKVFNNLDVEIAKIACNYVEDLLRRNIYNPLWTKIDTEVKKVSYMAFDFISGAVNQSVSNVLGVDVGQVIGKMNEVRNVIRQINNFTAATPKSVRTNLIVSLITAVTNIPGFNEGFNDIKNKYGAIITNIADQVITNGAIITNIGINISNYIAQGYGWLNGTTVESYMNAILSNDNKPDWIKYTIPNYDAMLSMLVREAYMQAMDIAFNQIGKQMKMTNIKQQLFGYLRDASNIVYQINSATITVMNVSKNLSTVINNSPDIIALANNANAYAQIETTQEYTNFMKFIDTVIASLQGDVAGMMSQVNPQLDQAFGTIDNVIAQINGLKDQPSILLKGMYDRGVAYVNAGLNSAITVTVSNVINTVLPMDALKGFKINVVIPAGPWGAGIMAIAAGLGTDYLRNTDLRTEGGKLLLSRIFGLPGGQTGEDIMGAGFDTMAGNASVMMNLMADFSPRLMLTRMNGREASAFNYKQDTGAGMTILKNVTPGGKPETVPVSEFKINEFIDSIEGVIQDTVVRMDRLFVSVNYGDWQPVVFDSQGAFKITGIKLIEGRNSIMFRVRALFTNQAGQEEFAGEPAYSGFDLVMDMMPIQTYPIFPALGQVVNLNNMNDQPVTVGLYNSDPDPDMNKTNIHLQVKRLNLPWVSTNLDNYYSAWTTVNDFSLTPVNAQNWKLSYTLAKNGASYPDGKYAAKIEAVDKTGNRSTAVVGFYNDTTPPVISLRSPKVVSLSNRLALGYTIKDMPLPMISSVQYLVDNTKVKESGFMSTGPGAYIAEPGTKYGESAHTFTIKVIDQAGNQGSAVIPFYADYTAPVLAIQTNELKGLVNSESDFYKMYFTLSDNGTYIPGSESYLRLRVQSHTDGKTYYAGKLVDQRDYAKDQLFIWNFRDPFQSIADGYYSVYIEAADSAGNITNVSTQFLSVDRTCPVVYEAYTMPMVMPASNGKTTLYYKVSESDDIDNNKGSVDVRVLVFDKYTGSQVDDFIISNPDITGGENSLEWTGRVNGAELPVGTYTFMISAIDHNSNETVRYVDAVKGGIMPVITSPRYVELENNQAILKPIAVAGNIGIMGVAKDPVWDNRQDFLEYALYIIPGQAALPAGLDRDSLTASGWQASNILTPDINRGPGTYSNVSLRPVENDSVLAYIDTRSYTNGIYTILLVSAEKDGQTVLASTSPQVYTIPGARYGTISYIKIANADSGIDPSITNGPALYPASVNIFEALKDKNDLTADWKNRVTVQYKLGLTNVEAADVSFGVYDASGRNVYHSRRQNLTGRDYLGLYTPVVNGYKLYQDDQGFHIIMVNTNDTPVRYSGRVTVQGMINDIKSDFHPVIDRGITYRTFREFTFAAYPSCIINEVRVVTTNDSVVSTNFTYTTNGMEREIILDLNSDKVRFELFINDKADPASIYIGSSGAHPLLNSLIALDESNTYATNESVQAMTNAVSFYLDYIRPAAPFLWLGQDYSGALVTNGLYRLMLTAEGRGGRGFDRVDLGMVNITSPLGFVNVTNTPAVFDPMNADNPNTTLSFIAIRQGQVKVDIVGKQSDTSLCDVSGWTSVYGNREYRLNYNGSSNSITSPDLLGMGAYRFRLIMKDPDNLFNGMITQYCPFAITNYSYDPSLTAALNIEGSTNSKGEIAVNGDSRFIWRIEDLKGQYKPPLNVIYRMDASGTQTPVGYPFVPFVSKAHKWYDTITIRNIKINLITTGKYIPEYTRYEFNREFNSVKIDNTDGKTGLFKETFYGLDRQFDAVYNPIVTLDIAIDDQINEKRQCFEFNKDNIYIINNNNNILLVKLSLYWTVNGVRTYDPWSRTDSKPTVSLEITIPKNNFDLNYTDNNYYKHFYQWASENKYYYQDMGKESELEVIPNNSEQSLNNLPYNNMLESTIVYTNIIDNVTNISSFKIKGKNGYVSRFVSASHKYEDNAFSQALSGMHFIFDTNLSVIKDISLYTSNSVEQNVKTDVNSAYRIVFTSNGNYVYSVKSDLYIPLYDQNVPFPVTEAYVFNYLTNTFKLDNYDKYDITENNLFLHPSESYINYGGLGKSYVIVTNLIEMPQLPDNNQKYINDYVYTKEFLISNYNLYTKGPVLDTNSYKGSNLNIHISDYQFTVLSVSNLDGNYEPTNSITLIRHGDDHARLGYVKENPWSLYRDTFLPGGVFVSGTNTYNDKEFKTTNQVYYISDQYPGKKISNSVSNAHLFWMTNGVAIGNPWLVIETNTISASNIKLYYLNGLPNDDLYVTNIAFSDRNHAVSKFEVGLKPGFEGRKIVEIKGSVSSPYELSYYDGDQTVPIVHVPTNTSITNGVLGFWNVTRLEGRYTVVLKAYGPNGVRYAYQSINVGEFMKSNTTHGGFYTTTPYRRAEVVLPASMGGDTLVNVTPVAMNEMTANDWGGQIPDISPIGPILKFEPSPYDFGPDPANWPVMTVQFTYTEVTNMGLLDSSPAIYTLTTNGFEPLNTTVLYLKRNPDQAASEAYIIASKDEFDLMKLMASAPHFSKFFVLRDSNMNLPAPVIDRELIRIYSISDSDNSALMLGAEKETVFMTREPRFSIAGIAAQSGESVVCLAGTNSRLSANDSLVSYNCDLKPVSGQLTNFQTVSNGSLSRQTNLFDAGAFAFANVPLKEGTNYLFVKYNRENSPIDTITVVYESKGAEIVFVTNEAFISPNGDGRYDRLAVHTVLSRPGSLRFEISRSTGVKVFDLLTNAETNMTLYWNGKPNRTNIYGSLPDGLYEYRLITIDRLGTVNDSFVRSFTLDTVMPAAELSTRTLLISAEGMASLSFTASEPVSAWIEIYNGEGALIRRTAPSAAQKAGEILLDAVNAEYTELADGVYTARFMFEDRAGNRGIPAGMTVQVDRTAPSVSTPEVNPPYIVPGITPITFNFFTTERGYASISLINPSVGIVSNHLVEAGRCSYTWNGLVNNRPIAAGDYTYVLSMRDPSGNISLPRTNTFRAVIDNVPPVLAHITLSTNRLGYLAPQGGQVAVTYCVTDNITAICDSRVEIVDSMGGVVAVLRPYFPSLTNTVYWHGKNDAGAYVPDGWYTARVAANDRAGNLLTHPAELSRQVLVDNAAPAIRMLSLNRVFISPAQGGDNGRAVLTLRAADIDPITARLEVRHNGILVMTYPESTLTNNVSAQFAWDAVLGNGITAPDGSYDIRLTLSDPSGNSTLVRTNVVVDGTAPVMEYAVISNTPFSPNGDTLRDTVQVSLRAGDNLSTLLSASLTVTSNDTVVRVISAPVTNGAVITLHWDGRDQNGALMPDGSYTITPRVSDLVGNTTTGQEFTAVLDNTPPLPPLTAVSNALFSPNSDGLYDRTRIAVTNQAAEAVWLSHTLEGSTLPYGWQAKGTGIYYPVKPAVAKVNAFTSYTNYLTRFETAGLMVSNARLTSVEYPVETGTALILGYDSLINMTCNYLKESEYLFYKNISLNNISNIKIEPEPSKTYLQYILQCYVYINEESFYNFIFEFSDNLVVEIDDISDGYYEYFGYNNKRLRISRNLSVGWHKIKYIINTDNNGAEVKTILNQNTYFIKEMSVIGSSIPNAAYAKTIYITNSIDKSLINYGMFNSRYYFIANSSNPRINTFLSNNALYARTFSRNYPTEPWTNATAGFRREIYSYGADGVPYLVHVTNVPEINYTYNTLPYNLFETRKIKIIYSGYLDMPIRNGIYDFITTCAHDNILNIYINNNNVKSYNTSGMYESTTGFSYTNDTGNSMVPFRVEWDVGQLFNSSISCNVQWRGIYNQTTYRNFEWGSTRNTPVITSQGPLSATNALCWNRLNTLLSIPPSVLSNGGALITGLSNNAIIGFAPFQNASLNEFLKPYGTYNLPVNSYNNLDNLYAYAWLPMSNTYSYNVNKGTNSTNIPVALSGLESVSYNGSYDNLNTPPQNGVITGFELTVSDPIIQVTSLSTNAFGQALFSGFSLSNTFSEAFESPWVRSDNQGIAYSPDGAGKADSIFRVYSYPAAINPALVRVTNWDVKVFEYHAGGEIIDSTNLVVTNITHSGNANETFQNGMFQVILTNPASIVYGLFRNNEQTLSEQAYLDIWNGTNMTTGLVLPDSTLFSKVYVRDEAYNQNAVVNPVTIDNTAPVIVINNPVLNASVSGYLEVRGFITDPHFMAYSVYLSNVSLNSVYNIASDYPQIPSGGLLGAYDTLGLKGAFTLVIKAWDKAGNTNTKEIPVYLDNDENQVFRIVSVSSLILNRNGTLEVVYDYNNCTVTASNNNEQVYQTVHSSSGRAHITLNPAALSDGVHELLITAQIPDKTPIIRKIRFTVDNAAPVLSLMNLTNQACVRGIISFTGSVQDTALSDYRLSLVSPNGESRLLAQGNSVITDGQIGLFHTSGMEANSYSDGALNYTVRLEALDQAGNSSVLVRSIRIDNARPLADLVSGNGRIRTGSQISFVMQDANIAGGNLSYSLDGTAWTRFAVGNPVNGPQTAVWNEDLQNGPILIKLDVFDQSGNTNSIIRNFTLDNTPPVVSAVVYPSVQAYPVYNARITDNDTIASAELYISNQTGMELLSTSKPETNDWNMAYQGQSGWSDNGGAYYIIRAVDAAGNITVSAAPFVMDVTAPVLALSAPSDHGIYDQSMALKASIDELYPSLYQVLIDGVSVVSNNLMAGIENINLDIPMQSVADGQHGIKVRLADQAGNSTETNISIIVDHESPVIALAVQNGQSVLKGPIQFLVSASDANPQYYLITTVTNGVSMIIESNTLSGIYKDRFAGFVDTALYGWNGMRTFNLEVRDASGHISRTTATVDLDNQAPIISEVTLTGDSLFATTAFNGKIRIDFHAADSNGMNYIVTTESETNTGYLFTSGTSQSEFNTFMLPEGLSVLKIRVIDSAGNSTELITNIYVDRTPPLASVTVDKLQYSPLAESTGLLKIQVSGQEKIQIDSIEIRNRNGQTVCILTNQVICDTEYSFIWNGKDPYQYLIDGYYQAFVQVSDAVGNQAVFTSSQFRYLLDAVPPAVSLTSLDSIVSYGVKNAVLTVNQFEDTGNKIMNSLWIKNHSNYIQVYAKTNYNGVLTYRWDGCINGAPIADGIYDAIWNASDMSGNSNGIRLQFRVHSHKPVLDSLVINRVKVSTNGTDNRILSSVNWSDSANILSAVYSIKVLDSMIYSETNDIGLGSASMVYTFNQIENGTYKLVFEAYDFASNKTVYETNVTVDIIAPEYYTSFNTLGFITNSNQLYLNANGSIRIVNLSSDLVSMRYALALSNTPLVFQDYQASQWLMLNTFTNGLYQFAVTAADDVGNVSSSSYFMNIDGDKPLIKAGFSTNSVEPAIYNGSVYISYTNRCNIIITDYTGIRYSTLTVLGQTNGFEFITNFTDNMDLSLSDMGTLLPDQYTFSIESIDLLSNVSTTNFVIQAPMPDRTAPISVLMVDGLIRTNQAEIRLNSSNVLSITAADHIGVGDQLSSGVEWILYTVDASTNMIYKSPFRFTTDGIYDLKYRSSDYAGNLEAWNNIRIIINHSSTNNVRYRSLVFNVSNILYNLDGMDNGGLWSISQTGNTWHTTNNWFIISNIRIQKPVTNIVQMIYRDTFGNLTKPVFITNILDQSIEFERPDIQPVYYRESIPVNIEWNEKTRSWKTLDMALCQPDYPHAIPVDWSVWFKTPNADNRSRYQDYIRSGWNNGEQFNIVDGKYRIRNISSNKNGEIREDSRIVYFDNTPPFVQVGLNGVELSNRYHWITNGNLLSLTAYDPVINGVSSGTNRIWYALARLDEKEHGEHRCDHRRWNANDIVRNFSYYKAQYGRYTRTITLTNGIYILAVTADDKAQNGFAHIERHYQKKDQDVNETHGNISRIDYYIIKVTSASEYLIHNPGLAVKPVITLSGVVDGGFIGKYMNINWSIDGAGLKGNKVTFNQNVWNQPLLTNATDGYHTIQIMAWNQAGLTNSLVCRFIRDTKDPVITFKGMDSDTVKIPAKISYTVDEDYPDSIQAWLNGVIVSEKNIHLTQTGLYTLKVVAKDKAGNYTIQEKKIQATIGWVDKVAPEIMITGFEHGSSYNSNVMVTVHLQDDNLSQSLSYVEIDGVRYGLNSAGFQKILTSEGIHKVKVYAADTSDNVNIMEKQFVIDKTVPVIQSRNVIENHRYLKIKPDVTVQDNLGMNITVNSFIRKDNGAFQIYDGSILTNLGNYIYQVTATDEAGNSITRNWPFTITNHFQSTLTLYADFNSRDYAYVTYGNNPWLTNSTMEPLYVYGYDNMGMVSHVTESKGVVYYQKINQILNPSLINLEWNIVPMKVLPQKVNTRVAVKPDFKPDQEMTILFISNRMLKKTVITVSIDPQNGTCIKIGDKLYFMDRNEKNRWYQDMSWKKLNLIIGGYENRRIRFAVNDDIIFESTESAMDLIGLNGDYDLYCGFKPGESLNETQYFIMDELKIYDDAVW